MNEREATFKANANSDDGTVPWHNDPQGRPFKSDMDKPLRSIAAFGCDRETNGGTVCPHWCGQDKCGGVVLAEPEGTDGVKTPDGEQR